MKLSRKVAAFAFAGALAFGTMGIAGCSSEEAADTAPQQITTADIDAQAIEITGVGFTVVNDATTGGATVNYAFTCTNPNDGYIADGVTFTIEGYDAEGTMLIGGGETIQEIYPGIETAAAGTAFLPEGVGEIARFEVQPLMEHVLWDETDMTSEEINDMFQISDVEVTDTDGMMTFTGTVSADLGEDQAEPGEIPTNRQDVHLVVLLRDADGNILGGGSSMGIMLDPTITATAPAMEPTEEGEDAAEAPIIVEPETVDPENPDAENTIARSTFTINIQGPIDYADYTVIATPGI